MSAQALNGNSNNGYVQSGATSFPVPLRDSSDYTRNIRETLIYRQYAGLTNVKPGTPNLITSAGVNPGGNSEWSWLPYGNQFRLSYLFGSLKYSASNGSATCGGNAFNDNGPVNPLTIQSENVLQITDLSVTVSGTSISLSWTESGNVSLRTLAIYDTSGNNVTSMFSNATITAGAISNIIAPHTDLYVYTVTLNYGRFASSQSIIGSSYLLANYKTAGSVTSNCVAHGVDASVGSQDSNIYGFTKGVFKYSYPTGGPITLSPVIDSHNTTYIPSSDGYLYAIDRTGQLLWKVLANITSSLALSGNYLIAGTSLGISSFDKSNGFIVSGIELGSVTTTPFTKLGNVFVTSESTLYQIPIVHGILDNINYQRIALGSGILTSPVANSDGSYAFVGSDSGCLFGVAIDGPSHFSISLGGTLSTPTISSDDSTIYVCSTGSSGGILGSLTVDTNGNAFTVNWSTTTPMGAIVSSPAIGTSIYVSSLDGKLYAFNSDDGTLAWYQTTGKSIESTPIVYESYVYLGSDDMNVYTFNDS